MELMISKTGMALSTVAIAVVLLLFASGPVVGDYQVHAYTGYYDHWWHPWWHYHW
ncbi:MAG: hypothetical protein WAM14_01070 [Candidatus Nitrosopolaris sp.]